MCLQQKCIGFFRQRAPDNGFPEPPEAESRVHFRLNPHNSIPLNLKGLLPIPFAWNSQSDLKGTIRTPSGSVQNTFCLKRFVFYSLLCIWAAEGPQGRGKGDRVNPIPMRALTLQPRADGFWSAPEKRHKNVCFLAEHYSFSALGV